MAIKKLFFLSIIINLAFYITAMEIKTKIIKITEWPYFFILRCYNSNKNTSKRKSLRRSLEQKLKRLSKVEVIPNNFRLKPQSEISELIKHILFVESLYLTEELDELNCESILSACDLQDYLADLLIQKSKNIELDDQEKKEIELIKQNAYQNKLKYYASKALVFSLRLQKKAAVLVYFSSDTKTQEAQIINNLESKQLKKLTKSLDFLDLAVEFYDIAYALCPITTSVCLCNLNILRYLYEKILNQLNNNNLFKSYFNYISKAKSDYKNAKKRLKASKQLKKAINQLKFMDPVELSQIKEEVLSKFEEAENLFIKAGYNCIKAYKIRESAQLYNILVNIDSFLDEIKIARFNFTDIFEFTEASLVIKKVLELYKQPEDITCYYCDELVLLNKLRPVNKIFQTDFSKLVFKIRLKELKKTYQQNPYFYLNDILANSEISVPILSDINLNNIDLSSTEIRDKGKDIPNKKNY